MRRLSVLIGCCLLFTSFSSIAQENRPKLVVGIVVDQMRWDYLYRFQNRYGNNGFKRLLREGFSCENTMIPYLPTYTAPGHTCIFTGSVPSIHGIVGNNWFEKETNKVTYCTDDKSVMPVGGSVMNGQMSPEHLLVTTVGDELRLSNNFQSRLFGIALKDRGGILPAGRSANAAYWFDDSTGNWITSTFYMKELPGYMKRFNDRQLAKNYMQQNWNTLYPINTYTLSTPDDEKYELHASTETAAVFPHLSEKALIKSNYKEMRYIPAGNTLTLDLAKTIIEGENLGKNGVTDFFEMSFSSTDYIGHRYGINSVEIEDTYLRLDKDLGDFLQYLDDRYGKDQYLVFLSADHGAENVPEFMTRNKMAAGEFDYKFFRDNLSRLVDSAYHIHKVVQYLNNYELYLDNEAIRASGRADEVYAFILDYCRKPVFIQDAFYYRDMYKTLTVEPIASMIRNGYNINRSGDIHLILKPGWFEDGDHASTHGVAFAYDRHIPLLFFGWNIKPGKLYREVYMTDIAPTVSAMLKIQMPSGCVGKVITELVK